MELKEFLRWAVSGGGAGILAYYVLERWQWFTQQSSEHKRYITVLVTFALANAFYLALVFAGYDVMPVGTLAWVEQLFLTGTTAFGLSQIIHAGVDLRANDKAS